MVNSGYSPIEKNIRMFGLEESGYTKERVDNYLSQLESAYINMKEKLGAMQKVVAQQQQQAQAPQMQQPPQMDAQMDAQVQKIAALAQKENAVLKKENAALKREQDAYKDKAQTLQVEIDFLKNQLAEASAKSQPNDSAQMEIIAKTMIDARGAAAEILEKAQKEADVIVGNAHRKREEVESDGERVRHQLRHIVNSLTLLLETSEPQGAKRSESDDE